MAQLFSCDRQLERERCFYFGVGFIGSRLGRSGAQLPQIDDQVLQALEGNSAEYFVRKEMTMVPSAE